LPCVDARQRLHGNALDSNEDIAVRLTKPHGKGLCRALAPLPCGRTFAVRALFAVRSHLCRARDLCRASWRLPCAPTLPCAQSLP
jgi:hypothetical protein